MYRNTDYTSVRRHGLPRLLVPPAGTVSWRAIAIGTKPSEQIHFPYQPHLNPASSTADSFTKRGSPTAFPADRRSEPRNITTEIYMYITYGRSTAASHQSTSFPVQCRSDAALLLESSHCLITLHFMPLVCQGGYLRCGGTFLEGQIIVITKF